MSLLELKNAARTLHKRDLDDDGTISLQELQASGNSFAVNEFVVDVARQSQPVAPPAIIQLSANGSLIQVSRQLLKQYDGRTAGSADRPAQSRRNEKLDRQELGWSRKSFEQYDADSDGELDVDEILHLLRGRTSPTVELIVRLDSGKTSATAVEIIESDVKANGFAGVRRSSDGLITLVFPDAHIAIGTSSGNVARNVRSFYLQQFKAADRDNNNYVDAQEAQRNYYFRRVFKAIDDDGDGRIFEKELFGFLDKQKAMAESRVVLNVAEQGRNLFGILDINGDRRLGPREFAAAAERISVWDEDGDGQVAQTEIARQYRLIVGRAEPGIPGVRFGKQAFRSGNRNRPQTFRGPTWFQSMDRNGDGDLSPREFLGTPSAFQKLDANGDGFIDPAETSHAE